MENISETECVKLTKNMCFFAAYIPEYLKHYENTTGVKSND